MAVLARLLGRVLLGVFPETRIVRNAQKAVKATDSLDSGSLRVIMFGMGLATVGAFPLAWVAVLRFPAGWQLPVFLLGTITLILGSLLRRHCFRMLGHPSPAMCARTRTRRSSRRELTPFSDIPRIPRAR